MGTVTFRKVDVDGIGIFYREAGPKDAPRILLLHGFRTASVAPCFSRKKRSESTTQMLRSASRMRSAEFDGPDQNVPQVAGRGGRMGWLRDGSIPLLFQGGVAAPLIKRSRSLAAQTGWFVNSNKNKVRYADIYQGGYATSY